MDFRAKKAMDKNVLRTITLVGQFGYNLLVPVVLCFGLGMALDSWLGTNYLVIVLFFIGAMAGMRNIFVLAEKIMSQKNK
jgi:F0F1-type ATP synthase assembly protein I